MKLILANASEFDIIFGGPVEATENLVFFVKIVNSDMDTIHETFKNPENTETLTISYGEESEPEVYTGYTNYCGFRVDFDSGITVTLKKNLGT